MAPRGHNEATHHAALRPSDALHGVKCGLEMISVAHDLPAGWDVRIGIHAGPVMAGVLGRRQYQFDLWGDTVNTAARIESHGVAGRRSQPQPGGLGAGLGPLLR